MNFPSPSRWRSWIADIPRFSGGPGEISLAGTISASCGVGFSRMRVFGQWALVYLLEGGGCYRDERGHDCTVRPGQWILVFPEIAHAYGPPAGGRWEEIYVCFRGPVFEAWRETGCFDPARPVGRWLPPGRGVAVFRDFFKRIQQRRCPSLEAVCRLQVLLGEIIGPLDGRAGEHPEWLQHALDVLEQAEPGTIRSVREIAGACGMSYESFRKKFQNAVGIPPGRYALGRRVERARRLLAMRQLSNKEVAELLGFYDEFHFSKAFSQFTGKTPRQFRLELSTPDAEG